ncbi:AHH domain-containing protein [Melittangium boletus]|uniref:Lipoprotein n=1 Tax=Melittangium boletus DSM 14713 TaxID=1294270 RepID=A0A286NUY7_9BACT|nr:AHH domain-containing protein [Melittangium boletus]ATB26846.1 lipoprotein [Melittangium boletus DSM 14713]
MRLLRITALLLLTSACATTRVVTLDTGQRAPIIYRPGESAPVTIGEQEFKSAVAQLILDMDLKVVHEASEPFDSRSLLASARGIVDGARGQKASAASARHCQRRGNPAMCSSLFAGEFTLGVMERRMMALSFALDTVWEGVEEVVKDLANPEALRAMVVSIIGTSLVMLVAPEPITKFIAMGLTASLIAYLGVGPVWNLGQGFLRLMAESKNARGFAELEASGHRFGKVLGGNGARILVLVAMTAIGGKSAMAAQGPKLPGAAQAAMRARVEGGFELSGVLAGQVRSISLPAAGVLNVALAPTAVATVAMGTGGVIQGDPDGDIHHICTDKNEVSDASGGPWTPLFEPYFNRAQMKLSDVANQVRIKGHKGPHPREYHQEVFRRIERDMNECRGAAQCRAVLIDTLAQIARELTTAGTKLRKLITRNTDA